MYTTFIDSAGHEINLTMYKGAWDLVELGKTYLCHNLQVDNYQIDGVNQLRTLAFSSFLEADESQQIAHKEDLSKRKIGQLVSFLPPRLYKSCPKCFKSLTKMTNEVCPNSDCNEIVNAFEHINDYVVVFVFDERVDNKEFEHVFCYRKSLLSEIESFIDEVDLNNLLDKPT